MPNRRPTKKRRSRGQRTDSVILPLAFNLKEGQTAETSVSSIVETFDRRRPFRIASIYGRLASYGSCPVLFQWEAYGPQSSADNVWVAPQALAVPNGHRYSYRIPVTKTGWYPSDVAVTTVLLKLSAICVHKATVDSGIIGHASVRILLQPREIDASCPKLMIVTRPSDASPSSSDDDSAELPCGAPYE